MLYGMGYPYAGAVMYLSCLCQLLFFSLFLFSATPMGIAVMCSLSSSLSLLTLLLGVEF